MKQISFVVHLLKILYKQIQVNSPGLLAWFGELGRPFNESFKRLKMQNKTLNIN